MESPSWVKLSESKLLYSESDSLIMSMSPMTKEERAAYMRAYRKNNPEYRDRERLYLKNWRKLNPEKTRKHRLTQLEKQRVWVKKYKENNPDKVSAHIRARYLPLDSECSSCASKDSLEHHHPDYSKPDQTVTLCKKCHTKIHGEKESEIF
ncbi:hypothetical protein LCGC14_1204540 [marine sediment metagenome]|uniref:Uncharacterized protein n=1 Tax=marine sediment metagenome TaxID=412755 RepID=A0A0F9PKP8_9ZZZZ